jgi:single-stranded-DNA-specific exonuclease
VEKRWTIKERGDGETIDRLAAELGIEQELANLLVQRGVKTYDEAHAFFRPELTQLHDPFLLNDMDKAIDRILFAKANHEKILVFGDYDVDGTTAVALVYTFLQNQGFEQLDFYIPDRYNEGYGVSLAGIDFASANNFKLIIALDCGIKDVAKVAYAKSLGVDFIICDHHRPGDHLPEAIAVLDPKRLDSTYPYNELSGCGLGFKLIQAYAQRNSIPFEELHSYLDLVVVSIASDIVPITGENRILAYFGLQLINQSPRAGFEAILRYSNINRRDLTGKDQAEGIFNRELTISDLVFLVGPRINAAGRIESGRNSVILLISPDIEHALSLAQQINEFNTTRRDLDSSITQQALEMILEDSGMLNAKSTVVFNPEWHKGVIGIVASRLTETYYRPTVVLTQSNGLLTGSARSIKDFDIYDAIDACSDLLEHFGGHKYAAGLSLKPENFESFKKRFEEKVCEIIEDYMLIPEVEIDMEINLDKITIKFLRILNQFAPFGPGNMSPVFLTQGILDAGHARIVGKNHIKLSVYQSDVRCNPFPAIAFQLGDHFRAIESNVPMDICYHVEENEWNGIKTIQLNIKDIKPRVEPVQSD